MCFSANASFGAGIVLSVIGIASIKKVQQPSQIAFASIPLLFAIQQITEGFLWLALTDPLYASMEKTTTYIFLFFAQIVWPIWVPFSIMLIIKKEKHKTIEKFLVLIGAIVSLYLGYCLLSFDVKANAIGHHIAYELNYPIGLKRYAGILYFIATIIPSFFSPIKRMWTLGLAILISYIITVIFYEGYIISVWCFFASIISITVYGLMYQIKISHQRIIEPVILTGE